MSKETIPPVDGNNSSHTPPPALSLEELIQDSLSKTSSQVEGIGKQIESDPTAAKSAFKRISEIIGTRVSDADGKSENDKEVSEGISAAQAGVKDTALQVFANSTKAVLALPDGDAKINGLAKLQEKFKFLSNDDNPRSVEEVEALILMAIYDSSKEVPKAADAIDTGFKNSFTYKPSEAPEVVNTIDTGLKDNFKEQEDGLSQAQRELIKEQRKEEWDGLKSGTILTGKVGTALTLALAVPPPLGLLLAAGFVYATWNVGVDKKEVNDPEVSPFKDAWKKFVKPPQEEQGQTQDGQDEDVVVEEEKKREITEEDREETLRDPTNTGEAAAKVALEESKELEEDEKKLKTDLDALVGSNGDKETDIGTTTSQIILSEDDKEQALQAAYGAFKSATLETAQGDFNAGDNMPATENMLEEYLNGGERGA